MTCEDCLVNADMLKVLRHLAEHFSGIGIYRLNTPFNVPGLDFEEQVAPILRRLASASPPYIEGISVDQADYPVVITGLTEAGREAAEAAGDSMDASPGAPASATPATAITADDRPFQVALSFAGEQRHYIQRVSTGLAERGIKFFYDEDQQITLWGKNLTEELQRVYMEDSHAVVMFISQEYAQKNWTRHERRSALSRALRERREYVLPVRFDATELPGLDPDISYLKSDDYSPEALADAIANKLVLLGGSVPAKSGPTVGWARAYPGRDKSDLVVRVTDNAGHPVNEAEVLSVAPNGTFVGQLTDKSGQANLKLPAQRLVTIFAAHPMLAPAIVENHDPKNDLDITLIRSVGVGSTIIEKGTGSVPGLSGRINPVRDTLDRLYLYSDNVAINDDPSQPHEFRLGEPVGLEDAQGNRVIVTIIGIIGRSSLIRFER